MSDIVGKRPQTDLRYITNRIVEPPIEVLLERSIAQALDTSPYRSLLGDPLPGRSALDMKHCREAGRRRD